MKILQAVFLAKQIRLRNLLLFFLLDFIQPPLRSDATYFRFCPTVIVMLQAVSTPPRALGLLLRRWIQTIHVVFPFAAAATQQTRRHASVP